MPLFLGTPNTHSTERKIWNHLDRLAQFLRIPVGGDVVGCVVRVSDALPATLLISPPALARSELQVWRRYYGWYFNPAVAGRGQRLKRADAEIGAVPDEGEVIEISEPKARRIPSKKWCELIKKVWEADPLLCPHCQHEMQLTLSSPDSLALRAPLARCLSRPPPSGSAVALIEQVDVIERILRHLAFWEADVRVESARDPPEPVVLSRSSTNPFEQMIIASSVTTGVRARFLSFIAAGCKPISDCGIRQAVLPTQISLSARAALS